MQLEEAVLYADDIKKWLRVNSVKATDIWPCDYTVFNDADFIAASKTDIYATNENQENSNEIPHLSNNTDSQEHLAVEVSALNLPTTQKCASLKETEKSSKNKISFRNEVEKKPTSPKPGTWFQRPSTTAFQILTFRYIQMIFCLSQKLEIFSQFCYLLFFRSVLFNIYNSFLYFRKRLFLLEVIFPNFIVFSLYCDIII